MLFDSAIDRLLFRRGHKWSMDRFLVFSSLNSTKQNELNVEGTAK